MNNMNKENKQKNININKKVLDTLSEKNICLKPEWEFTLKNSSIWILGIVTIFAGALSISASIFVFKNIQFNAYKATHENILTFFIEFIPVIWIILLILFIFSAHYLVRHTDTGYKYKLWLIILGSLLASFILGVAMYFFGFGQVVDRDFGKHIPYHKNIELRNDQAWNHPEEGLLSGYVILEEEGFLLKDFEGSEWNLIVDEKDLRSNDILNNPNLEKVRLVGILESEHEEGDVFYVCHVMPYTIKNPKTFGQKPPRDLEERSGIGFEENFERNLERKSDDERSNKCKDVRPYQRLLKTN